MNNNEKAGKKRMVLSIILAISLLLAAGGWGTAIYFNMTRTPRLNPGALENLKNNPLVATSDSELLQAIERRNSASRGSFTGKEISEDALQLLGWAATGKNRDGTGFVIPLAMGAEPYVSLYLVQESGVRRFLWESNSFENVIDDNILNQISSDQKASAVFIYIIEKDKVPSGNMNWAWHTIGAMSEHQYLVADEFDIQARFMASIDADKVITLLGFDASKSLPAGVMVMAQK
ncbi:MAG: nitroreductase family protein [Candidatus Adiutrix sp.]